MQSVHWLSSTYSDVRPGDVIRHEDDCSPDLIVSVMREYADCVVLGVVGQTDYWRNFPHGKVQIMQQSRMQQTLNVLAGRILDIAGEASTEPLAICSPNCSSQLSPPAVDFHLS